MKWLDEHFLEVGGFPRPYWAGIFADVKQYHSDTDQYELWCDIARSWLKRLTSSLPPTYAVQESDNFLLVTSAPAHYVSTFQAYLERTLKRIIGALHDIASADKLGKYAVLLFDEIDLFYAYRSYYYKNKGVCEIGDGGYINKGYRHFAFPQQELPCMHRTIAHEMTHALLCHLPIPAWLNEGMAVGIEDLIACTAPPRMDNEMHARHRLFWGTETIQEFWSGRSFFHSGEGQELSYHLAQLAVHSLSQDRNTFARFANNAHRADAGQAAIREIYNGSLGNLVTEYLGAGDWAPKPDTWSEIRTNDAS